MPSPHGMLPAVQGWSLDVLRRLIADGLRRQSEDFIRRTDGSWFYSGPPRGAGWHRHGTTPYSPADLCGGELVGGVVHKQRWLEVATGITEHDRPPDQVGRRQYTAIVIVVALAGWLLGSAGVHAHEPLLDGLRERPAPRTLQRWRANAIFHAADLAHGVRLTWLALKPRQAGDDVPGGIPPPVHPGPWRGRSEVERLASALSMALGFAVALNKSSASLLAEVWRRHPDRPFITD